MDAIKRFGIAVGFAGLFVFLLPVMVNRVPSEAVGTDTYNLTTALSASLGQLLPIAVLALAGALLLTTFRGVR
ncbi:MAG: hypothetical protein RI544_07490 [Haloquadratum sp.]|jgi:hypothetical protein|nr:hypothetical protein [Haloquadratum sp.]